MRVYRFKIALKQQKRLWRRIEIKGDQTLGDLDRAIREAFKHELWDHLSMFYRGKVWRSGFRRDKPRASVIQTYDKRIEPSIWYINNFKVKH